MKLLQHRSWKMKKINDKLTHEEIGQMLDHRPFRIHRHMVLVRQQPTHVRDAHPFVDQEALTAPVQRERFDEELLNARLPHLFQRQADLLRLRSARCICNDKNTHIASVQI